MGIVNYDSYSLVCAGSKLSQVCKVVVLVPGLNLALVSPLCQFDLTRYTAVTSGMKLRLFIIIIPTVYLMVYWN